MKPPTCDAPRCKRLATWDGFDGRSHFCEIHKPVGSAKPYTPGLGMFKTAGELTGVTFKPKRKRR